MSNLSDDHRLVFSQLKSTFLSQHRVLGLLGKSTVLGLGGSRQGSSQKGSSNDGQQFHVGISIGIVEGQFP